MAYFTRTLKKDWRGNRYLSTGAEPMVAHESCLPDDQFEIIGPEGHELRHQREPWCWSPTYGGVLAVKEGRMEYDSPWHLCHYCNEPVA